MLTRRAVLTSGVSAAIAPVAGSTVMIFDAGTHPVDGDVTLADFTVLSSGKIQLSPRAVQWANEQAASWARSPQEMEIMMATAVENGTWPYEYEGTASS